ncbi:MAG: MBL fold metallo-hydrolase [Aestuariivirga sp.]
MLAEGVRWFDGWFAIEDVSPGVYAIGEPRFHQINWNYLIAGRDRALLFDTGPGVRDISEVVKSLTDLPVTAMPSHMHFDHTGNLHRFENIAIADLPILRACERVGIFHAADDLFLGFYEGMTWNPVKVSTWLPIGTSIDLGGRKLDVIHTPGHSPDSVSLLDRQAEILFAADYVYPGSLYAQILGADLADYLKTAESLLPILDKEARLFCAHGKPDKQRQHRAPMLHCADIADLAEALRKLKKSGEQPEKWRVNERLSLLTGSNAFASWRSA